MDELCAREVEEEALDMIPDADVGLNCKLLDGVPLLDEELCVANVEGELD